jgi:hypothetical protein
MTMSAPHRYAGNLAPEDSCPRLPGTREQNRATLCALYRAQFPVLQQYERETYNDQRGKIVFTTNRGLSGVGLDRKRWEEVQNAPAGSQLPDWAHDAGGRFIPPFDSWDREADMAQAYHHFADRLSIGPATPGA